MVGNSISAASTDIVRVSTSIVLCANATFCHKCKRGSKSRAMLCLLGKSKVGQNEKESQKIRERKKERKVQQQHHHPSSRYLSRRSSGQVGHATVVVIFAGNGSAAAAKEEGKKKKMDTDR
jgi:hypothetical protein